MRGKPLEEHALQRKLFRQMLQGHWKQLLWQNTDLTTGITISKEKKEKPATKPHTK